MEKFWDKNVLPQVTPTLEMNEPKSIFMIPIKYLSLLILVVQNSALVLVMRYSRIPRENETQPMYLASTAVVMSELMKTLICLLIIYRSAPPHLQSMERLSSTIYKEVFLNYQNTLKLLVPALLYTIQNNLQYLAVSLLDAATFQVTYQMKILTTAFFSVVMLKKILTKSNWVALGLLTFGIALVQLPPEVGLSNLFASRNALGYGINEYQATMDKTGDSHVHAPIAKIGGRESGVAGLLAVATACVLSGAAGVYFEKILKGSDSNLWIRNVQMSIFSCLLGLIFGVFIKDGNKILEHGFFQGYTIITWSVIACQAGGGLIVAMVVKYADNILKGFATSISIILSSLVSVWLFDFVITLDFLVGSALVIYATYLYGVPK